MEGARAQLETVWPGIKTASVPPEFIGDRREEFLATRLGVKSGARGSDGLFFGVQPGDPWTMVFAAVVLVSVSIVAAIRPALRAAAGIDPMSSLRAE